MTAALQNPNLILSGSSLILAIFSLAVGIIAIIKIGKLKKDNEALFSGKNGTSLEDEIIKQTKDLKELDKEIQELFEISNSIHNVAQKGIHKVGLVRFNPFKEIGGDQSFALALLNGKKTGVVLSSLHTREGTRVYAKPVDQGKSKKYQLTEEEMKAISNASLLELPMKKEIN
jgi:hypothetical protein